MTPKRFALVDCNNFFVSCERVFNPKLLNKPVVVLSSNDACVIARSNEAKRLGIKMGEPFFACKELVKRHNIQTLSSNFGLYSDMSSRIMQTLCEFATDVEVYSIDEAFIHLPRALAPQDTFQQQLLYYAHYAQIIRKTVLKNLGLPVSIGLGPTKTLAKIANGLAKKHAYLDGVFDITNHSDFNAILRTIEVRNVWGIGSRSARFLIKHGITTAYQLTQCDDTWVRKNMTITGLKTVLELRGISCIAIENQVISGHEAQTKKSIIVSRSFGTHVTSKTELQEAVSYHITTAAEKLRAQKSITGTLILNALYMRSNDPTRYYTSACVQLAVPTSYTPTLIQYGFKCLNTLYKKGLIYKKIGVMLNNFFTEDFIQLTTFSQHADTKKQALCMKAIDAINAKMGKRRVFFASSGMRQRWHAKCAFKSPAYTTNWREILTIKI